MGYLKDLLLAVHENRGKGKKFDVMDYLWHEMWAVIVCKRNACYGPLIMRIILVAWEDKFPEVELSDPDNWVLHKDKRLRIKDHIEPSAPPTQGRRGKAKGKVVVDEDEGGPSRPPSKGSFAWMARALKKVFTLNKSIERRQWEAHYDNELKRRKEAQVAIQSRRDAGETVVDVEEPSITTYGRWQARDSAGQALQWSSEDEEPEISSRGSEDDQDRGWP